MTPGQSMRALRVDSHWQASPACAMLMRLLETREPAIMNAPFPPLHTELRELARVGTPALACILEDALSDTSLDPGCAQRTGDG